MKKLLLLLVVMAPLVGCSIKLEDKKGEVNGQDANTYFSQFEYKVSRGNCDDPSSIMFQYLSGVGSETDDGVTSNLSLYLLNDHTAHIKYFERKNGVIVLNKDIDSNWSVEGANLKVDKYLRGSGLTYNGEETLSIEITDSIGPSTIKGNTMILMKTETNYGLVSSREHCDTGRLALSMNR